MPNFWGKVYLVYLKDLKDEIRSFHHLVGTLVFGVMLVFISSYALQLVELDTDRVFPAVLWVSVYFAATLALQRAFSKEHEKGSLDALLLASGDRGILFLAKFLCSLTVLLILEVVVIPLFWVFLGVSAPDLNMGFFFASLFLGSWGLAAIGTMLNGMTVQLPGARLLFPVLMFPLLIPLLMGAILCSQGAVSGEVQSTMGWVYVLLAFDFVFTITPLLLFDYVLEG
ncbi:MAG: heme exporter protein CcmB [Bacillota bacterium]|nr:heme exporter protein CcmB [Bacillota bacterium]